MQVELTQEYVIYQAKTKLADLAYEIAQVRDLRKTKDKAILATKIRLWLKALDYATYLDRSTREKIWYCLADMADVNGMPYAPVLGVTEPPTIVVGVPGARGQTGARGEDGGATDFGATDVAIDAVVDSFEVTATLAARWDYVLYGDDGQRAGTIIGTWTADGVDFTDSGDMSTDDATGATDDVRFDVYVSGTTVSLIATIASGTWSISGSRYFIPNNGTGVVTGTSLAEGKIWIGSSASVPTAQTMSGDATITTAGVLTIANSAITNVKVSASAAIALSKLAALTASKVAVTDGSGVITTSSLNASQLTYLTNVTSDIQTQIDTIASAGAITGAITTVVTSNLTASRAVVSNPSGKIAVSTVTTTELGYLSGVTSAIQTQLAGKVNDTGDTITGTLEVQGGIRTETTGPYLKTKVIEIGDWNMDSSATKSVAHGLSDYKKIRSISVIIRDDDDINYHPIWTVDGGYSSPAGSVSTPDSTDITLSRASSNYFDSTNYDSTGFNRGWISITYEA